MYFGSWLQIFQFMVSLLVILGSLERQHIMMGSAWREIKDWDPNIPFKGKLPKT
jgi:hypothetical protein